MAGPDGADQIRRPETAASARRRLNTAISPVYSMLTNAYWSSGDSATSMPPMPPGMTSVPRTACGLPCSALATSMTSAPRSPATRRYRPSRVSASPSAVADGSGMVRTTAGPDGPPVRSTATPCSADRNDQCRSAVATTPNGSVGTGCSEVPAGPSARACAVAVLHPGSRGPP
jgi:hypothetical protein